MAIQSQSLDRELSLVCLKEQVIHGISNGRGRFVSLREEGAEGNKARRVAGKAETGDEEI